MLIGKYKKRRLRRGDVMSARHKEENWVGGNVQGGW